MPSLVVKVKPASAKDEISLDADGMLTIKIKERPIDGAANAYLLKFLAKEFKVSKNSITLEKGTTSRFKKIVVDIDQPAMDNIILKLNEGKTKS